jgi:heptosyltransferase-3
MTSDARMPAYKSVNIQPKRILVITQRYLGDTLLVTPLLSSLKQAYPDAELDVLLPASNLGMLEGNRDVAKLIPLIAKPGALNFGRLLLALFRRYDIAISTQAGDRPVLCAILAGKFSMGFTSGHDAKNLWKNWLLSRSLVNTDPNTHSVLENLRFCELLKITPCYRITPPRTALDSKKMLIPAGKYVVLHVMPQWRYKQWHEQGWIDVAYYLHHKGYQLLLTGSRQEHELAVLSRLQAKLPPETRNLAGQLSLSETTLLIEHANIFIGPDTGITHLAAATGVRTIALFGPTDPKAWGPWPLGYSENWPPFASVGAQTVNNVCLIQGQEQQGCVPCQLEGCERHRESRSACLDNLTSNRVIDILSEFM